MQKRDLQVLGLVVILLLGGIFGGLKLANLLSSQPSPSSSSANLTTNKDAPISVNGSPLPSVSKEDVEIVYSFKDSDGETAAYIYREDFQTSSWEVSFEESGLATIIRQIGGTYYIYDSEYDDWSTIDEDQALDFFDPGEIVLRGQDFESFNSIALQLEDETCGELKCAVWESEIIEPAEELIRVRVDYRTRKIYDISGIGDQGAFTSIYDYKDVVIDIPELANPETEQSA